MFDDFIHMIPRAFGYRMSKSFYIYLENCENSELENYKDKKKVNNTEKNISKDLSEKKDKLTDKKKKGYFNLSFLKGIN